MSDTTNAPTDNGNGAEQDGSGFTPPQTQEELNRIIAERVNRTKARYADYGELREKASKFDELAEASKSETQRLIERAEKAERAARDYEIRSVRAEVAAAKGVPADALAGSSREDFEKAADTLISWRDAAAKSGTLNPRGGFYSGASGSNAALNPQERAAAAMRELGRNR